MTSFYYYDQNPSGLYFLVQIRAFANLTGISNQIFKIERKKKRILVVVIEWHHRAKANNWDIVGLYYFHKISSISTSTLFIKNGITIDWPTK